MTALMMSQAEYTDLVKILSDGQNQTPIPNPRQARNAIAQNVISTLYLISFQDIRYSG
jgi:hypothetical protein